MLSCCKNALGRVPPLHQRPGTTGVIETRGPRRGCGRGTEVFPVARPLRLRYKLMLGLGLVIGSVVLLVGGTLYGIRAYNATVRTTERKMYELQLANILIETLKGPDHADPTLESLQSAEWQLR